MHNSYQNSINFSIIFYPLPTDISQYTYKPIDLIYIIPVSFVKINSPKY